MRLQLRMTAKCLIHGVLPGVIKAGTVCDALLRNEISIRPRGQPQSEIVHPETGVGILPGVLELSPEQLRLGSPSLRPQRLRQSKERPRIARIAIEVVAKNLFRFGILAIAK